jgi:hypothetical protein
MPGLTDSMYIFIPKIPIWVYFGGRCNGKFRFFNVPLKDFVVYPSFWYVAPKKYGNPEQSNKD